MASAATSSRSEPTTDLAAAVKLLAERRVGAVVILGADHRGFFDHSAASLSQDILSSLPFEQLSVWRLGTSVCRCWFPQQKFHVTEHGCFADGQAHRVEQFSTHRNKSIAFRENASFRKISQPIKLFYLHRGTVR
ncbi:MAG: hypothetical protein WB760_06470 [Xanthobacteraceae bacterium]